MDNNLTAGQHQAVNQVYQHAIHLLVNQKLSGDTVVEQLVSQGIDSESANHIVASLQEQIKDAKQKQAKKDIVYGALWCVGGIVATAANIGFIFWGAIVFGGIQLIKGVVNYGTM